MKRFRGLRRRSAALALLPAAAVLSVGAASGIATGAESKASSFKTSKAKVRPGAKVKVRGKFEPPAQLAQSSGEQASPDTRKVRIQFRPAGERNWRKAKTTTTDRDGRYLEKVKVKRSGRFRAVHADGRRSKTDRVRVKAKLRSRVADKHARRGEKVPVKGQVIPRGTKRKVVVKVGGDRVKTRTKKNGRFKAKWKASGTGSYKVRVKAKGDKAAAGAGDRAGKVKVYRPAQASWYGPGFYGNRTACGQTLTTSTQGVAHKTMPCGTKLTLRYNGRSARVRVIDRGPYVGDREFDLTYATKRKLGFGSTGTVWSTR